MKLRYTLKIYMVDNEYVCTSNLILRHLIGFSKSHVSCVL